MIAHESPDGRIGKSEVDCVVPEFCRPEKFLMLYIPVSRVSYLEYGSHISLHFLSDRIDISSPLFLIMH